MFYRLSVTTDIYMMCSETRHLVYDEQNVEQTHACEGQLFLTVFNFLCWHFLNFDRNCPCRMGIGIYFIP